MFGNKGLICGIDDNNQYNNQQSTNLKGSRSQTDTISSIPWEVRRFQVASLGRRVVLKKRSANLLTFKLKNKKYQLQRKDQGYSDNDS